MAPRGGAAQPRKQRHDVTLEEDRLALGATLLALLVVLAFDGADFTAWLNHALMGFFFGVLHLAYGTYLYITENRKSAA